MAFYKHGSYLGQQFDASFDQTFHPEAETPYSGIYRCEGCGHEIAAVRAHRLPPQNHHQHTIYDGSVRWKLIVKASHL
ncbi:MAG: hypothetical protein ACJ75B_14680 [Flavisolibacter sp.]